MSDAKPVVLLLEDEPLIAMDIEMHLRDAGFDVTTVASCEEANEWLLVCRPDAAIVDVMLRDGSCHDIVTRLFADGVPFVVHSGDPMQAHHDTVFTKGLWLSKPAVFGELIAMLSGMTTKPLNPSAQPPL